MNTHRYLAGAAVALVLTVAGPAYADLLGGSVVGAANGTLSGRMGDIGGMANGRVTGSIDAQTDAIDRAGQRTRAVGGRVKDRTSATVGAAKDRAKSTADDGRDAVLGTSAQTSATAAAGVEGGVDQSISASKSLEAGDRTVEGGGRGARRDRGVGRRGDDKTQGGAGCAGAHGRSQRSPLIAVADDDGRRGQAPPAWL